MFQQTKYGDTYILENEDLLMANKYIRTLLMYL